MGSRQGFEIHEWLIKTNFSFLMGASHPRKLLETALALGYQSLCINDMDGLYGVARAYNDLQYIKNKTGRSLKLNYGMELHIRQDHDQPVLKQQTLVLNALSWEGYKNICKLASLAHQETKDQAWLSVQDLTQCSLKDVFAIVPMRGGLQYFLENEADLLRINDLLKGDLYLALTKSFNQHSDSKIKKAHGLAVKHGIKELFSQDVFFSHRSEKSLHYT